MAKTTETAAIAGQKILFGRPGSAFCMWEWVAAKKSSNGLTIVA
jgi:hypothetical protein